jgi:hypothetical protein
MSQATGSCLLYDTKVQKRALLQHAAAPPHGFFCAPYHAVGLGVGHHLCVGLEEAQQLLRSSQQQRHQQRADHRSGGQRLQEAAPHALSVTPDRTAAAAAATAVEEGITYTILGEVDSVQIAPAVKPQHEHSVVQGSCLQHPQAACSARTQHAHC